ncbi:MAG TPA: hypothetical protein VFA63_02505, partial [Pseudonocardiaceae bacterium]|nr:hypothetical protein [Pseudonocardiaceae bacterium]
MTRHARDQTREVGMRVAMVGMRVAMVETRRHSGRAAPAAPTSGRIPRLSPRPLLGDAVGTCEPGRHRG